MKVVFLLIFSSFLFAQHPDVGLHLLSSGSGTYSGVYSENSNGTFYVRVYNIPKTYDNAISFNVFMTKTGANLGTAKFSNSGGSDLWRDDVDNIYWSNDLSGSSDNEVLSITNLDILGSGTDANGDGLDDVDQYFPVTIDVIDDFRYEDGISGTPETIHIYVQAQNRCQVEDSTDEFLYKITDNDEVPIYGFENTETQDVNENRWIEEAGNVIAYAHSDGNTYLAGRDFTVIFTVSNGASVGTLNSDHRAEAGGAGTMTGTIVMTEWANNGVNIDHYLTDDNLDEPNETFTIALTESDVDGLLKSGRTSLNYSVIDASDDTAPYVYFKSNPASSTVSEAAGTVSITAKLQRASGYNSVYVGYTVSGTADASGTYADHDLAAGTLTFGAAGDLEQSISFDITNDVYDEGVDATAFETIVIAFNGGVLGNLTLTDSPRQTYTMSIQDNDATPTASFAGDAATAGNESVTSPAIGITLSAVSGLEVTVTYAENSSAGTATKYVNAGTAYDFQLNGATGSGTLTFPAYTQTVNIPLTILSAETLHENNETVNITATAGNNVGGGSFNHTYAINNDDNAPSITFLAGATSSASEAAGTHNVVVEINTASGKDTPFDFAVTDAEATGSGTDYTLADGTLTISAGATTANIPIVINNDVLDEADENIEITLSNLGTTSQNGSNVVHTFDITDNDNSPTIDFSEASSNGSEATATKTLTIRLSAVSGLATSVDYTVTGGSATAKDGSDLNDFTLANGTASIAAGQSNTTFDIAITNDSYDEVNETIEITLSNPNSNTSVGSNSVYTYTINDDDAEPTIQFNSNSSSGAENVSAVTLTANLSAASGKEVTVGYADKGTGDATGSGTDFAITSGTLTFPASSDAGGNNITQTFTININDDALDEADNETAIIELIDGNNSSLGTNTDYTYTIQDNDDKPTVGFFETASTKDENAGTVTTEVRLSALSGRVITVDFAATGGTATGSGTDYTLNAGTLTFAAGEQSKTISVLLQDDNFDEPLETIIIDLSGQSSNAASISSNRHTLSITDADAQPTLEFASADITKSENFGVVTISVGLAAGSTLPVEYDAAVNYVVKASTTTAKLTQDYTFSSGTATLSQGAGSSDVATFQITIIDDGVDEDQQQVVIELSGANQSQIGTQTTHTLKINDNDNEPTIEFQAVNGSGAESASSVNLTVALSDTSEKDISIDYTVNVSSTALGSGTDYTMSESTLNIAAGAQTNTIPVVVVGDQIDETDAETIIIDLDGTPTNAVRGSTFPSFTYSINDDDPLPSVYFSDPQTSSSGEGTTPAQVEVTLSAVSGRSVQVSYTDLGSGNATSAGTDYTLNAGVATIAAGNLTANIDVAINDDTLDEEDETIIVGLTASSEVNATINAAKNSHTLTIEDDDLPPSIQFAAASTDPGAFTEDEGTRTLTIELSAASSKVASIDYAISALSTAKAAQDYTLAAGTATINAGQTSTTVDVVILNDAVDEPDGQTLIITLSNEVNAGLGSRASTTLIINDDDSPPTVSFTQSANNAAESNTNVIIAISLSDTSEQVASVDYIIGGTATVVDDHNLAANTVTFTAGEKDKTITFIVVDDVLDEENQTVIATIINAGILNTSLGANAIHTYTINDNDPLPTIYFENSVSSQNEANGTINVAVKTSAVSERNVQVNYTITGGDATRDGTDYTRANGISSITAGATSTSIDIVIVDDVLFENNETIEIGLTASSEVNGTIDTDKNSHTHTILNIDSPPGIQFADASVAVTKTESDGTFPITIELNATSSKVTTVDYTISALSTAKAAQDYTLAAGTATINAGATTTTFNVAIINDVVDEPEQNIRLLLENPSNSDIGANNESMITITDDDAPPTANLVASSNNPESSGTVAMTVTLTDTSEIDITIPYTINALSSSSAGGVDHNLADGNFSITKGTTTGSVNINIQNDTKDEINETIIVDLTEAPAPSDVTLGTKKHIFTITDDDDLPTISFLVSSLSSAETVTEQNVIAKLNTASGKLVTAAYQVLTDSTTATGGGIDYSFTNSTFQFPEGVLADTAVLTIINDDLYENNDVVYISFNNDTANTTFGINTFYKYIIINDEAAPTISFTEAGTTFDESTGIVKIPINLNKVSGIDATVDFSVNPSSPIATGGGIDYDLADNTFTMATGKISDSISVILNNDNLVEGPEKFIVSLSNAVGSTPGADTEITVTINDDDIPPPDFTLGKASTAGTVVTTGYWNSYNTSFSLNVPVAVTGAADNRVGGSVQIQAKSGVGAFTNIGNPTTIVASMTDSIIMVISKADFQDAPHASFNEGSEVSITAVITDKYTNSTTGTKSPTILIIDTTLPTVQTVSNVLSVGGTVVPSYWNGTNESILVDIPLSNDASLVNGTIQVQSKISANALINVGTPKVITGAEIGTTVPLSIPKADITALVDYGTDNFIYMSAIVTDIAGNIKQFNTSSSLNRVDTIRPFISSSLTTKGSGLYDLDKVIDLQLVFDDTVSLIDGTASIKLNVASGGNLLINPSDLALQPSITKTYTVIAGDSTSDLMIDSILIDAGPIRDMAGNSMNVFTILSGSNINDSKDIKIDGIAPEPFTVDSIKTDGGTINLVHYNSTNTGVNIEVFIANDASLVDGLVQIRAKKNNGSFSNIGSAYVVQSADLNDTLIVSLVESDFNSFLNGELSAVFNDSISFNAILTDKSGNATTGTRGSSTTLILDEYLPIDGRINLITSTGGNTFSGYFNSTNSALNIDIKLNNPPDLSLAGGKAGIQLKTTGNFSSVGTEVIIGQPDVDAGFIQLTIDSTTLKSWGDYTDNQTIYFRGLVTDVAGNLLTQAQSDSTIIIDETGHSSIALGYARQYVKGGESVVVTANFSEAAFLPNGYPTINQPHIWIDYQATGADVDSTQMTPMVSSSGFEYTYTIIAPGLPEEIQYDGLAKLTLFATDIAGNPIDTLLITNREYLYIDNTAPEAGFTYSNITRPSLESIGIAGDEIQITVNVDEEVLLDSIPYLSGLYNSGTNLGEFINALDSLAPISSENNTSFVFNMILKDSMQNDGKIAFKFNAKDKSLNTVTNSDDSSAFTVDNIHPWGVGGLFAIATDSVTFPTDSVYVKGTRVVEHWINGNTDSIFVGWPLPSAINDPTLYGGGSADVQVQNITRVPQGEDEVVWKTLGVSDSLIASGSPISYFGRSVDDLWSVLPDGVDLVNGDKLIFRGILMDANGNKSYGQSSGSYLVSNNSWISTLSEIDTVGYDTLRPLITEFDGGNIFRDSLVISSDELSFSWTEFIDPGTFPSGFDKSELQIYELDSTGNTVIDSLYPRWTIIPSTSSPTSSTPFIHNTSMLKHRFRYFAKLRGLDIAGNLSAVITSGTIRRKNSAPVITEVLDRNLFEDIPWIGFDTIKVADLDLSTLQGDSFSFAISSARPVPQQPATSNIATIDSIGAISWIPTQEDTGIYTFQVIVNDKYAFSDTIIFNTTVNAVNDTPRVNILGEDRSLLWKEDDLEIEYAAPDSGVKIINLTSYVNDVDNQDSTDLTWQVIIMDTTELDEDWPSGQVVVGPGTPVDLQMELTREYLGFNTNKGVDLPMIASASTTISSKMLSLATPKIDVKLVKIDEQMRAIFSSDPNYHGSNHRIIFRVTDPDGAFDLDTVIVTVNPRNDPPVMEEIERYTVNENDSIWIDFAQYVSDIDDSVLTFDVKGIFKGENMSISPASFVSIGPGDSVLFKPLAFWSDSTTVRVSVTDKDTTLFREFTLDVIRVPRPHMAVSVIQNNAFSNFLQIIIVDTLQTTRQLSLEIQNEKISLDTVSAFTWTGDFNFSINGTYSFDVVALGIVGDTVISNQFALSTAQSSSRWSGISSDATFSVIGEAGAVNSDQSFLIVDSTLFSNNFSDQASYVLGDESYKFKKHVEINFLSSNKNQAVYQRVNGVSWEELPSIGKHGKIITFTDKTGYFRLGQKTIIVPEQTSLHQNYPNPFNPITTLTYDIGLMDGFDQKISIDIYNILGQQVKTIVNNKNQIGQFKVQWDGQDKFGNSMPSGLYFVQLTTSKGIVKNKKMMLLK